MSLFERAAKCKLRFQSNKGMLSTEDLFDLSLTSLDTLAKSVNKQLKDETEESFVTTKSVASTELELKLDLLKHVIGYKVNLQEANKKRAENAAQREKIKDILVRKQSQELEQKTPEELMAMLNSID